jgi:hypothetical protein
MAQSLLQTYIALAKESTQSSIGTIMRRLNPQMTLAESKCIDYALSHVEGDEGVAVMERFLFGGTQIQRNYCALYFGRRGDYDIVRRAYDQGLVDAKQAFSR